MAAKRFDATLKHLLETYPRDLMQYLLPFLGIPRVGSVEVVDADLSTVTAAADRVFRIGGRQPWLLHLEIQSSHDPDLARNLLRYNVLLEVRHDLSVRSLVLLLRPQADRRSLTGELRREWPEGDLYLTFCYGVVRLWQQPVEALLTGGLGLLPLAPLADVPAEQVEGVVHRMEHRIAADASQREADDLWAATYVLLGLTHSREFAAEIMRRVLSMKDSVTYQAIIEEGEVLGARMILLDQGSLRFGPPDEAARATLLSLNKPGQLKKLGRRLLEVSSWEELLATPRPRRSGGRRRSP